MSKRKSRSLMTLVAMAGCIAPAAIATAALTPYSQNFEAMAISDPAALSSDGWVVFGNVFGPGGGYLYGYGTFPAPNPGGGFSAVAAGEGGVDQGAQQLSIYSDYNNADHGNGNTIEANVFQERGIVAGDVGGTWNFTFDAKLGNLAAPSTALAFIKTLDPANGFATTNFITLNTTAIPTSWNTYSLQISITPGLVGQILQFGFSNSATNYNASGVFYDNINFNIPTLGTAPLMGLAGLATLRRRRA